MNKFKKAEFEFLVATDVAARGIDVDELELVVNYDLPYDAEDYVHRIGRTGRAGRKGMAVTFVSGRDIYKLQFIERFTKTKIKRGTLPTAGEVEERRIEGLLERIREVLNRGNLSARVTDRLLEEGFNSTDIASAVIEMLAGPEVAPEKEKPAPSKPTVRSEPDLPMGNIRPPARGMLWVRTNAGRETGITPRDIMSLLEDGLGLPRRTVGLIDILPGESFAQVPKQFLDTLRTGPREIDTNSGPIVVSLVPYNATSKSGADEGKPKFSKKPKRDK
jgi:ATP-dependent RNA helicase DeaD